MQQTGTVTLPAPHDLRSALSGAFGANVPLEIEIRADRVDIPRDEQVIRVGIIVSVLIGKAEGFSALCYSEAGDLVTLHATSDQAPATATIHALGSIAASQID